MTEVNACHIAYAAVHVRAFSVKYYIDKFTPDRLVLVSAHKTSSLMSMGTSSSPIFITGLLSLS